MSDTAILAAAFHDTPGLLAVRLSHPAQGAVAFAVTRRPDAARGKSSSSGCGGLIVAGVVVAVVVFSNFGSCSSGGGDSGPKPKISAMQSADVAGLTSWAVEASDLGDDLAPSRTDLKPWAVRALLDVPRELARRGPATGGWLAPACSPEDRLARDRAWRLAKAFAETGQAADTAVILDLPGAQAVAAAAGMSGVFDPVFTSDSLPHPSGVVPSAQTLAAALYWRPQFAVARGSRAADAGPCFILEGDRLAPYANEQDRFDNRTHARLPGPEALRALGVRRVLYVRPSRGVVAEADDLNELFAALPAAGIEVRHVGLDAVEPEEPVERSANHASSWLWLRTGWGRGSGQPDPDSAYRAQPRAVMGMAALDGGAARRSSLLDALAAHPPRTTTTRSGGSWFRSSSSHHHGS